jgi:hypothetical protein
LIVVTQPLFKRGVRLRLDHRYDLQKPFAVIARMSENGDGRPYIDAFRTAVIEYHDAA